MKSISDYAWATIEDCWRTAALCDQKQFFGRVLGGVVSKPSQGVGGYRSHCAMTILQDDHALFDQLDQQKVLWECPSCRYEIGKFLHIMIHLNNAHHWTWDMFANKFRDEVERGIQNG